MEYNSRILECLCKASKGQSGTSTLPLELPTSEQIWRSPLGEANPFLPNRGFKTQAGWLPFMPEGGLLFSPPMNPSSQPLGKAYLEDIFSGVVSTELGPSLETQRHRGRQDHMDKPLLFSIALMNLTLSGSFLIPTETHLCVKLRPQRA